MRIARVDVFGYELHYAHGSYTMSGGRTAESQPSTLVRIVTDEGVDGWGEACPLGATYLPAFAGGVRAALRELAPALLGQDPCNLGQVRAAMDAVLQGQPFAKSPVDVACWDILGKATQQPVAMLLGGRLQERFPLYSAVPLDSEEAMAAYVVARRAEGIRHFQLKVGGDPGEDARRVARVLDATEDTDVVVVDANGGWSFQQAVIAARLLEQLSPVYLEQPCASMAECIRIRALTSLPMIYDEVVLDPESLAVAVREGGAGAVNLKIGKFGGLSGARLVRDLARSWRVGLTIEDTWGGDVATAAVSHLAASTDRGTLFTVSFFNDWTREHVAGYRPRSVDGWGSAPEGPGLGIEVDVALLGEPLFSVSRERP